MWRAASSSCTPSASCTLVGRCAALCAVLCCVVLCCAVLGMHSSGEIALQARHQKHGHTTPLLLHRHEEPQHPADSVGEGHERRVAALLALGRSRQPAGVVLCQPPPCSAEPLPCSS